MQNPANYRNQPPPQPMQHHQSVQQGGGQQQQSGPYNQNAHMRQPRPQMQARFAVPPYMPTALYSLPPGQVTTIPIRGYQPGNFPQHPVQPTQPIISPPYYSIPYIQQGGAPQQQGPYYQTQPGVQYQQNRIQHVTPVSTVSYSQVHPQTHSHVQSITQPQPQQQHQPQQQQQQPQQQIPVHQQANPSQIQQQPQPHVQQHMSTQHYVPRVDSSAGRPVSGGIDQSQGQVHQVPVQGIGNKDTIKRPKKVLVFTNPNTGEKFNLGDTTPAEEGSSKESEEKKGGTSETPEVSAAGLTSSVPEVTAAAASTPAVGGGGAGTEPGSLNSNLREGTPVPSSTDDSSSKIRVKSEFFNKISQANDDNKKKDETTVVSAAASEDSPVVSVSANNDQSVSTKSTAVTSESSPQTATPTSQPTPTVGGTSPVAGATPTPVPAEEKPAEDNTTTTNNTVNTQVASTTVPATTTTPTPTPTTTTPRSSPTNEGTKEPTPAPTPTEPETPKTVDKESPLTEKKVPVEEVQPAPAPVPQDTDEEKNDDEELVIINKEDVPALPNGGTEKFEEDEKDNVPLENSHELSTVSISPTPIENYCDKDNSMRSQDDSIQEPPASLEIDGAAEAGQVAESENNIAVDDEDEVEEGELPPGKEEDEEGDEDENEENEASNKPSIRTYDRELLLRIGRETTGLKSKVDIPIADVIKVGNGKSNHFEMSFNQNQRTPMSNRQPQHQRSGQGRMDGRGGPMGQPIMHPGMRMGMGGHQWSMGQPLAIPPTPPPRVLQLAPRVELARDPNAWRPNRRAGGGGRGERDEVKDDSEKTPDEKQTEAIVKQTRGILNKLTPENFDKLCEKFLKLDLNERQDRISAVIKVVFEKAIDEPSFSTAYAQMVHHVCQHSQETAKKFRKEILDQCQKEFQKTNTDEDEIAKKKKEIEEAPADKKEALKAELEEFRTRMRRRSLGNVRFIGELFKLQMLTPKIMVDCVQMLLGNQDEESYECLCKLLTTVGQKLDNSLKDVENRAREAKARGGPMPKFIPEDNYMDKTFKRLKTLSGDQKLSSRIRFALLDLVEMRDMKWVPRRDSNAPKKIDEVRRDAIREEQEEKRQIQALPDINPNHLGGQRRQSPMNQNQSTQQKKGDWNTVPSAKSSRFNQVKKSSEVSNSPVLAPTGVSWGGPPPFNRPSSNNSSLPPRLQQQQLQQQQQQQNRFSRFGSGSSGPGSGSGSGSGNRFNSLSTESSSSSSGINLMPGGGSMSTGGSSAHMIQSSQQQHQRSPPPPSTPTQQPPTPSAPRVNPADLQETVKNIFEEYLTVQNSEDTLFWIKDRFPDSHVLDFIDTLAREVAEMSKEHQHIGAGKLVKMLIKQKYVQRDQALDTIAKGVIPDIPDIQVDSPKVISYVAKFVLELFADEGSLDWLMELSQPLKEDFEETYVEFISTTLDLFKLKRNEQFVKSLWNNTKNKGSLLYESLPWLSDESRTSLVNKMIPVLEQNDPKEIVNIFKEKSWDLREVEISSAFMLAICEVSFVDGKWDDKKLGAFLRLLNKPSGSVSTLWKVAKDFIQQKGIKKDDENILWNQLHSLNLVTNKDC